jgi:hypothetical protein
MLKIGIQIFFGKTGEKFRLGTSVDFTNAIYQLPFTHMHISFKISKPPLTWRNIDSLNFFSLAGRPAIPLTPYNPNYHIKEASLPRIQHMAQPNKPCSSAAAMSNKIVLTTKRAKAKKLQLFCFFIPPTTYAVSLPHTWIRGQTLFFAWIKTAFAVQ